MLKNYQSFLRKKNTKTSHKLSMVEKVSNVSSNNSLYSETKKFENFLSQKNVKIAKRAHAFKFMTTLVLEFKKIGNDDKLVYDTFYSHPKAETIINETDIGNAFKSIYTTIISNLTKIFRKKFRLDF